ncbi:HDOD domain-containing protein [methanotrophic endosymbiont of Bathymodiolus puteoserpentis (Logatchev)]|uniref:HDOD domain-containing protein n=1 Tax=methanotrophic endosymbiont of Bathymodiolus puteoserpentis (Logatchev) TaxID=343235 RepID=UPI00157B47C8
MKTRRSSLSLVLATEPHKVIQLTADVDSSAKDIVAVIESDPVMTVKILKVINSAFYSLPQKITSIQRALVYIGINTIKNLALSVAAIGALNPHNKAGFDTGLFLEHSLVVGVLSKKLAERMGVPLMQSSDYFVAGLLHDFGKIVFAEFMPYEFKLALEKSKTQQVDLHLAELEIMGINHAQAGRMLALKWELAENLANAIDLHHSVTRGDLLVDCVFAANQIAKKCRIGDAGNSVIEPFSEELVNVFGMSLDELVVSLGDMSIIKSEVQQFMQA